MRPTTLILNAIVVFFFTGFLAYTWMARRHLDGLAREFVTERTLAYSTPIVEIADQALDTPLVRKLLTDEQAAAIRREIVEYRKDAAGYIADLTRQKLRPAPVWQANPLLAKVASLKVRIRTFYDETLNALVEDLRIFSASNLVAGAIAFTLAWLSRGRIRKSVVWFSFLMFAAVVYCSWLYVDDLTFFRILFRAHLGWWYAVLLGVMVVAPYLDYGRERSSPKPTERPLKCET